MHNVRNSTLGISWFLFSLFYTGYSWTHTYNRDFSESYIKHFFPSLLNYVGLGLSDYWTPA